MLIFRGVLPNHSYPTSSNPFPGRRHEKLEVNLVKGAFSDRWNDIAGDLSEAGWGDVKKEGKHEETLENCRRFGNSHNRECTFQKILMVMDLGTKCMKVDEIWWFSVFSWIWFRPLSKLGKTHIYIYIQVYMGTPQVYSAGKFNLLFTIAGDGWQHANEDWSWRLMKVAIPKSIRRRSLVPLYKKQMPWFHDNIKKWYNRIK